MADTAYSILIVDDSETTRDKLSQQLEDKGYRVLTAVNGAQGLRLLTGYHFDLVVLDIMMRGTDTNGLYFLREIRRKFSKTEMPVIMATDRAGIQVMVQAFELGANDYVTKPIDIPVLLARIESELGEKQRAVTQRLDGPDTKNIPITLGINSGAVLAKRYRIDEKIGSGGYARVYRAHDLQLKRDVAVKVLKEEVPTMSDMQALFQREAVCACQIKHVNAVTVMDYGVTPEQIAYLVMELLDGESLANRLAVEGPVAAGRCAEIMIPICRVLMESHARGIVHRDLKPGNIFLDQSQGYETVKVLDFGLAKVVDGTAAADLTFQGLCGTLAYMAPERLERSDACDQKQDIYSIGVILYELLAGKLPYDSEGLEPMAMALQRVNQDPTPIRDHVEDLLVQVEALLNDALDKEPENRPSAYEFACRLAEAVDYDIDIQPATHIANADRDARPKKGPETSEQSVHHATTLRPDEVE